MMNKQKLISFLVIFSSSFICNPVLAQYPFNWRNHIGNGTHYICTRSGTGVVTIRKGPSVNHPRGLEQVGSGGASVSQMFAKTNYTLPVGFDLFDVFGTSRGSDNSMWTNIGTNQWTGYVRSDFICKRR